MVDVPSLDELVEAGAKAVAAAEARQHVLIGDRISARAALSAALPLVVGPASAEVDRAALVYENFKASEDQGYRSRDRQYAMDMLRRARTTHAALRALAERGDG